MTGAEAEARWAKEKSELCREFYLKPRKEQEAAILASSEYRSGTDSVSSLYMGSLATATVINRLGGKYRKDTIKQLLPLATQAQLIRAFDVCAIYYKKMINNPTTTCPCCGQIVPAKRSTKKEPS